jgi:hypothetical protein
MIDADELDTEEPRRRLRPFDRTALGPTLLYSIGLGVLGVVIILVGILGAFQH